MLASRVNSLPLCNTTSAQEIAHMIVTVLPVLTPPLQSAGDTLIAPHQKQ